MPIEFDCPHCGSHLSLWDELAGKQGSCPQCRKPLVVPDPQKAEDDVQMECPICGADIDANARICTHCGTDLKSGAKFQTKVNEPTAAQKVVSESADQVVGLLWKCRFLIAGAVTIFVLMGILFSVLSKGEIDPAKKLLEDGKPPLSAE